MASPGKKAFLLRLDPELWAQLERLAAADLRSVNAQIEFLLRDAVAKRLGVTPASLSRSVAGRGTASPRKQNRDDA